MVRCLWIICAFGGGPSGDRLRIRNLKHASYPPRHRPQRPELALADLGVRQDVVVVTRNDVCPDARILLVGAIILRVRPAGEGCRQQNGRFSDAPERAGLSLPEPPEKPLQKSTPGCILSLVVSWRGAQVLLLGCDRVSKPDGSPAIAPQHEALPEAGTEPFDHGPCRAR